MSAIASRGAPRRVLYALKPASWPKLLVPLLLGQAIGVHAGGFRPAALVVGTLFTLFGLAFIVLLNDVGDREVDAIKRAMFPESCSPKTIPDGILPARALLWLALAAGVVALSAAALGGRVLDRAWLFPMGVLDMCVFLSYTMPPLRLNYRGGGELLEMLGVGALLPWFNAYAQSGLAWGPGYWVLPGFSLLAFASALASGLSDEVSDRRGGKTTFVTWFGNPPVRRAIAVCVLLGAIALFAGAARVLPLWLALLPSALVLAHLPPLVRHGEHAVTNAFGAQAQYKAWLHRAIWRAACVLAGLLLLVGGGT